MSMKKRESNTRERRRNKERTCGGGGGGGGRYAISSVRATMELEEKICSAGRAAADADDGPGRWAWTSVGH